MIRKTDDGSKIWNRVLGGALAIPGTMVNRDDFLRKQLQTYCSDEQIRIAIEDRPASAGIPRRLIDKLADAVIRNRVLKASGISFATGLPGGWWMAATIPADLVSFYRQGLIMAQELAYLYGWPDLRDENGDVDEETKYVLTMLMGAMLGSAAANRLLTDIARRFAGQVARRLPRQALTKFAIYNLIKKTGKWIGISITKTTFARGASKIIPIVGGALSAGVTAVMMRPMGKRLKKHLRTTKYASPSTHTGSP